MDSVERSLSRVHRELELIRGLSWRMAMLDGVGFCRFSSSITMKLTKDTPRKKIKASVAAKKDKRQITRNKVDDLGKIPEESIMEVEAKYSAKYPAKQS